MIKQNKTEQKNLCSVAVEEAETTLFIALYDQTRQHFLPGCAEGVFVVSTDLKERELHNVFW